jgi:hypothetical protein
MILVWVGVNVPLHGEELQHLIHYGNPQVPVDSLQVLPDDVMPTTLRQDLIRPEDHVTMSV